jgi:PAS domain S-box-containing protein
MKKARSTSAEAAELRRRAEDRLQADSTKGAAPLTEADTQRLVHELQVHQIELEMQSEELWQSRAEAEAGLEHYIELYDFAPVGYLILDRDGTIRKANFAGAELLGVDRSGVVGRRFEVFVDPPGKEGFKAFLEKAFTRQAKEKYEVTLRYRNTPFHVQIIATVSHDMEECRVMLMDIPERRRNDNTRAVTHAYETRI